MSHKARALLLTFLGLLIVVLAISLWPKKAGGPDLKVAGWGPGKKVEKAEEDAPVDRVDLEMGGKKVTLARADKGRWTLTPPEGARADRFKVRQILNVFQEPLSSVVSSVPKAADLPVFGLDDATRIRVTLFQGGAAQASLDIGSVQKPEGGAYGEGDTFVRVPGQDRAYRLIARDLRRPFEEGLKGLRDKKVFDFEAADVTAVSVSNPSAADEADRAIDLVSEEKAVEGEAKDPARKPDRVWRFAAPAGVPAGDVKSFASSVASLYVQEFADELPAGVVLGPDAYRVTLTLGGGRKVGLALSATKDDAAWAQVDGVPGFAKLTKYAADSLRKRVGDLRDKALFGWKRDQVAALEVEDGGKRVRVERRGNEWKAVEPAGLPLGRNAMEQWTSDLETVRADAFVPASDLAGKDTGLDAPAATVTVTARDGGRKVLRVGKEKDKGVFYARLDGAPEVFTLPQWMLAKVRKGPSDLRNKVLFPFDEPSLARIEIARKDETLVLERVEGADPAKAAGWKAVSPQAADLKPEPVRTLVATLAGLQAKEIGGDKAPKSLGSAATDLTISVTLKDGSRHVVKVTAEKKDGDPWALSPTEKDFRDVPFTLNPYQVKSVDKRLAELKM